MEKLQVTLHYKQRWQHIQNDYYLSVFFDYEASQAVTAETECTCPALLSMTRLKEAVFDLAVAITKLTSVVIYNLALTIQTIALTARRATGELSGHGLAMLETACRLYTTSNQLQVENDIEIESPMFSLAMFNNCGRCYRLLGDETNAASCFQVLLQALLLLHQFPNRYDEQEIHTIRLCPSFQHNTTSLILQNNGNAAAA
jgi:hypothetical protein